MTFSEPISTDYGQMIPINFLDECAFTILCANFYWGNVLTPRGGRKEHGVIEVHERG